MKDTVAVLGAGNAGYAFCAHLGLNGFKARLYEPPSFKDNILPIVKQGGLTATGKVEGFTEVEKASTNMEEIIKGAHLIFVVVPAFAQEFMMEECLPYLEDEQIIIFMPGNYAAIRFFNLLKERECTKKIIIGETSSMLYACRKTVGAEVFISAVKDNVHLATIPSSETTEAVDAVNGVLNHFIPANNVFEISMNNLNHVVHPAPTILNAGRIENTEGGFDFYWEGMTESVCQVIEEIDKERVKVIKALGVESFSTMDILRSFYGLEGKNLFEMLSTSIYHGGYPGENKFSAPKTLHHRYLTEDIPYGLVPLSSFGKYLGCKTDCIDAIIRLSSILTGISFEEKGITVDMLKFKGMDGNEIINYVK